MNLVILTGTIDSEIKTVDTANDDQRCHFILKTENQSFSCILTGGKTRSFLLEAEAETHLSIEATVTDGMRLIVLQYRILRKPSNIGKVFDYKGRRWPYKETLPF